jgi:hypothetical protein
VERDFEVLQGENVFSADGVGRILNGSSIDFGIQNNGLVNKWVGRAGTVRFQPRQEWNSTMRRITGFVILSVFLLMFGWVTLRSPKPPPRCLITVNVIGLTNDASGARQATLLLSNAGSHGAYLAPAFGLEKRSVGWRTNLIPARAKVLDKDLMGVLPFHPRSKRLAAGESYEVTIPLPFDDLGWRASFWYMEDRPQLTILQDELYTIARFRKKQDLQAVAFTDWTDR